MGSRSKGLGRARAVTIAAAIGSGLGAYLLGFAMIFLRKAESIRNSSGILGDLAGVDVPIDLPAAWQVVGWLHYGAHNIDIVLEVTGLGQAGSRPLPLSEIALWERWFVLVPVVTLLIAGAVVAIVASVQNVTRGFLAGSSVVLGYGSLAVAGLTMTAWEDTIEFGALSVGVAVSPDPLGGVLLTAVVYPVVLGGIGGAVVGATNG